MDNTAVTYSGPAPLDYARLNEIAERVVADPQAVAWAEHNYESTGALGIPLVTLHTRRDAAVPMVHETRYARKAALAGRADLLVQRTVDHVGQVDGHCTFTLEEELAAFSDLVAWVESGERPTSP